MMQKPVISGAYCTDVGELPRSTTLSLLTEAALGAIADAGLTKADIDGLLCAHAFAEPHPMLSNWLAEYLGLETRYTSAVQMGGAAACVLIMHAAALVTAGMCRHVLVVTGENRLSGLSRDGAVAALADFGHPEFERPYGMFIPAGYALVAQRYMHEYGTTGEQLAAVAVVHRHHATRHPKAHKKGAITIDEVCRSRTIASPLRLLDCCLISDGGAAVVVSAAETAWDRRSPVVVLGAGQGHTHEHLVGASTLTEFGCYQSSRFAFAQAGVTASDIDVAGIYDSFTITLVIELESMGFFERGEAGVAALAGALDLGGQLPCNTHGGLLSFGHSGAAGGMFHVVEMVEQLRGTARGRQVADAELAFVHGCGGVLSAHCSLVLGRR